MNTISLRAWYLVAAICCAGLLGYALYAQYRDFLDPCPLCIFQRVAFAWIGLFSLLAAIHNPARTGQVVYASLMTLGAVAGALIAGRHVWLQYLPPGQVPECGPGLNYLLETLPFTEVLKTVLLGSGGCAEVQWSLLGLSMPAWTLIWFIGLGLTTLWFTFTRR